MLISTVKPESSTAMKSVIVALYTADDDNPLRYSGKIGMLQLDYDRPLQTNFLRFYDIDNLHLLLEVEPFYGFGDNFRSLPEVPNLYIFDLFADGIIGFLFRN